MVRETWFVKKIFFANIHFDTPHFLMKTFFSSHHSQLTADHAANYLFEQRVSEESFVTMTASFELYH